MQCGVVVEAAAAAAAAENQLRGLEILKVEDSHVAFPAAAAAAKRKQKPRSKI